MRTELLVLKFLLSKESSSLPMTGLPTDEPHPKSKTSIKKIYHLSVLIQKTVRLVYLIRNEDSFCRAKIKRANR